MFRSKCGLWLCLQLNNESLTMQKYFMLEDGKWKINKKLNYNQ